MPDETLPGPPKGDQPSVSRAESSPPRKGGRGKGSKPHSEKATGKDTEVSDAIEKLLGDGDDYANSLRLMLSAIAVPGRGAKSFQIMADEMNQVMRFSDVDKDNLENWANFNSVKSGNPVSRCEYAFWLHTQFTATPERLDELYPPKKERKTSTPLIRDRAVVRATRQNLKVDLLGALAGIFDANVRSDGVQSMKDQLQSDHADRFFYTTLFATYRGDMATTRDFQQHVLRPKGSDEFTAQFWMYRFTGRPEPVAGKYRQGLVYRSHYTISSKLEPMMSLGLKDSEHERPSFYLNTFSAVGQTAGKEVKSRGYVIPQKEILYFCGYLTKGHGIHVVAIPAGAFTNDTDEMRGMALSVDVGGVSAPVAAKVLLLRDNDPTPISERQLHRSRPRFEDEAIRDFFDGQIRPIKLISNEVDLALTEPVEVEGREGKIHNYEELITAFAGDLRQVLKGKIQGNTSMLPETRLLPGNLRGITALTLG